MGLAPSSTWMEYVKKGDVSYHTCGDRILRRLSMTTAEELPLRDCHVLIVDDSFIGVAWARYLQSGGATSETVPNVRLARRRLALDGTSIAELHPDVILIDFELTGQLSGSQLAAELRAAPHLCHILRISISGYARDIVTDGFEDPGTLYHDYLAKETIPSVLAPTLAVLLQRHQETYPLSIPETS